MKRLNAARLAPIAASLLCTLAGCNDAREATYPVVGIVRFSDGTPVRFGNVELRSDRNARIARGVLNQAGRFTLGTFETDDGAVAGTHQAIVVQLAPPEMLAQRPPGELTDEAAHAAHGATDLVSPEFAQYSTTPLTVTVVADETNRVELTVTPLPRQRP